MMPEPMAEAMADRITLRYATAGFWLLVSYAVVATLALAFVLYFETVVRQSPPVIECAAPSTHGTPNGTPK